MMTKAQTYIEKKLNEKISVELQNSLWAEEILTARFIKATGDTLVEYSERVKIE